MEPVRTPKNTDATNPGQRTVTPTPRTATRTGARGADRDDTRGTERTEPETFDAEREDDDTRRPQDDENDGSRRGGRP